MTSSGGRFDFLALVFCAANLSFGQRNLQSPHIMNRENIGIKHQSLAASCVIASIPTVCLYDRNEVLPKSAFYYLTLRTGGTPISTTNAT